MPHDPKVMGPVATEAVDFTVYSIYERYSTGPPLTEGDAHDAAANLERDGVDEAYSADGVNANEAAEVTHAARADINMHALILYILVALACKQSPATKRVTLLRRETPGVSS